MTRSEMRSCQHHACLARRRRAWDDVEAWIERALAHAHTPVERVAVYLLRETLRQRTPDDMPAPHPPH